VVPASSAYVSSTALRPTDRMNNSIFRLGFLLTVLLASTGGDALAETESADFELRDEARARDAGGQGGDSGILERLPEGRCRRQGFPGRWHGPRPIRGCGDAREQMTR